MQVSKPFLPPQKKYEQLISKFWKTKEFSNNNSLVIDLEKKLKEYIDFPNVLFFENRIHAFEVAIQSLGLTGEIITTLFSPVVLNNSNAWGDCIPVYVDVEESTLNIDAKNIEASITSETSAILATHVFGNLCDVLEIERIAKKYRLMVIYDASHAFEEQVYNHSVFQYGDVSIYSIRSTKMFSSLEGVFMVYNQKTSFLKSKQIRNIIINTDYNTSMEVINLNSLQQTLEKRKKITQAYDEYLNKLDLVEPLWKENSKSNYSIYPLLFPNEELLLRCLDKLESYHISASRSFYPLMSSSINDSSNKLKVADDIGKRVLCLPLCFDLNIDKVALICAIIQYELLLFQEKLG